MVNFAEDFVLSVLLVDGGQAVLCAFGLFGGGNRGFSNPCPPLKCFQGGWPLAPEDVLYKGEHQFALFYCRELAYSLQQFPISQN